MANMEDMIRVALAEEGYLEKRTNDMLESKTANAGSNNYCCIYSRCQYVKPCWYRMNLKNRIIKCNPADDVSQ